MGRIEWVALTGSLIVLGLIYAAIWISQTMSVSEQLAASAGTTFFGTLLVMFIVDDS